jgi:D-alanyl-D-alanine carboxypeptidase
MRPGSRPTRRGAPVPDIRAAAAIIFNPETGQVLWEENAQDKAFDRKHHEGDDLPWSSSKDNPDLSQEITVERGDVYAASTTYLRANERITLDNVLHLTLIASDNAPPGHSRVCLTAGRRRSSSA